MVQSSCDKGGKFEKLLTSPTPKAAERSMVSLNKTGFKRINPDQDMTGEQSPFRTPPSLSYCPDKVLNLHSLLVLLAF